MEAAYLSVLTPLYDEEGFIHEVLERVIAAPRFRCELQVRVNW